MSYSRGIYRSRPRRVGPNPLRRRANPRRNATASTNLLSKKRVKDYVKAVDGEMRMAGDALEGLEERIRDMIERAIKRAKANRKKTLKSTDF